MKFRSTSWLERNYKTITALSVVIATIVCSLCFLLKPSDNNITFFTPIAYALLLYLAGVFSNSISSQILSSLPEKAEIYKNLKKVEELLNSVNKKEENGLEEIRDAIIWVRLFTGRLGKEEIDSKPYIRKNLGFSVDKDYVIIEQEYCDTYDTLQKSVETAVRKYVQENNIQSKTPYFIVNEKAVFEPAQWCKNTFDDYKGVLEVIYNSFEENRKSVDLLENLIVKIGTCFERFQSQCKESLKQIESLFGRKLTDYLEQE